jgi:hypothetical protein
MAAPTNYCPTQEEIRAICEQIQQEWSEAERYRRTVHKLPKFVEMVVCKTRHSTGVPVDYSTMRSTCDNCRDDA